MKREKKFMHIAASDAHRTASDRRQRPPLFARVNRWALLGVALVLAITAAILFRSRAAPQLRLQGRTVLEWSADLRPTDREKQERAAAILRQAGESALPDLIRGLQHPDPLLKGLWTRTHQALWPRPRSVLYRVVRPNEAAAVRESAARGLAELGPAAELAVPHLIEALRDPTPRVAAQAAATLARAGEQGPQALMEFARTNRDPYRRAVALGAIGEFPSGAHAIVPGLIAFLRDADSNLVQQATFALLRVGPASADPLIEALSHSQSNVRQQSALILGQLLPPTWDAVPVLVDLLRDPVPGVRSSAISSLARIQGYSAPVLAEIQPLLKDPDEAVRLSAVSVLWSKDSLSADDACRHLLKLLTSPRLAVRESALGLLEGMGPKAASALPVLREYSQNNAANRATAQRIIERIETIVRENNITATVEPPRF